MARNIPSNKEAEQSLLSSMFISKYALEKATDTLSEEDFYFDNNRVLYSTLDKLNKNGVPIDMTSVVTELKNNNKLDEAGGIATIATILATHGLNIKNIGIIHDREFEEGVLHIEMYDANSMEDAITLLQQHRYTIHKKK